MMDQQVPHNFGTLLHRLDQSAREQFRCLEKYQRRVIQSKFAGMFNLICINEKLLSKYSDIDCHEYVQLIFTSMSSKTYNHAGVCSHHKCENFIEKEIKNRLHTN